MLFTPIDHGSAADDLGNGVVVRRTTTIVNADETAPTVTQESSHSPAIFSCELETSGGQSHRLRICQGLTKPRA
jgi:hypothetical protein